MSENETIPVATAVHERIPEGVGKPTVDTIEETLPTAVATEHAPNSATAEKETVESAEPLPMPKAVRFLIGLPLTLVVLAFIIYDIITYAATSPVRVISETEAELLSRGTQDNGLSLFLLLPAMVFLSFGCALLFSSTREFLIAKTLGFSLIIAFLVGMIGVAGVAISTRSGKEFKEYNSWTYSQLGVKESEVAESNYRASSKTWNSGNPVILTLTSGETIIYRVNKDDKTGYSTVQQLSRTTVVPS